MGGGSWPRCLEEEHLERAAVLLFDAMHDIDPNHKMSAKARGLHRWLHGTVADYASSAVALVMMALVVMEAPPAGDEPIFESSPEVAAGISLVCQWSCRVLE